MDLFALLQNQLGFLLLVFVRITGIFMITPFFGSRNVHGYIKAGLALVLTYILYPMVYNEAAVIPDSFLAYFLLVISEFLIGLILGFVSSLLFSAIQMSGQLLDMQIGFGVISIIDPQSGQQVPLVGNFKYVLAMLVFLVTNGHHVVLAALFSSFKWIPVTKMHWQPNLSDFIVNLVGGMFVIALKISIPVLAAVVLTDVALGILARTMPQMNIFVVGVPSKIIVGIFVLSLALPFYILFLELAFNEAYKDLYRLLALFG